MGERLLVPGQNFTTWGELKLARARSHFDDLIGRAREWNARGLLSAQPVLIDSHRVEFQVCAIPEQPPLDEWSLTFGDGLHCLRAAMDGLLWHLARLDGKEPDPKVNLYFPVAREQRDWPSWEGTFPTVDPLFRNRMKSLQRWNVPHGGQWPLGDIHHLDIEDKHNGLLHASAGVGSIDIAHALTVGNPGEVFDPPAEVEYQMTSGSRLREGVPVYVVTSPVADIHIERSDAARVEASPTIELRGQLFELGALTDKWVAYIRYALDTVYGGADYAVPRAQGSAAIKFVSPGEGDTTTIGPQEAGSHRS